MTSPYDFSYTRQQYNALIRQLQRLSDRAEQGYIYGPASYKGNWHSVRLHVDYIKKLTRNLREQDELFS